MGVGHDGWVGVATLSSFLLMPIMSPSLVPASSQCFSWAFFLSCSSRYRRTSRLPLREITARSEVGSCTHVHTHARMCTHAGRQACMYTHIKYVSHSTINRPLYLCVSVGRGVLLPAPTSHPTSLLSRLLWGLLHPLLCKYTPLSVFQRLLHPP